MDSLTTRVSGDRSKTSAGSTQEMALTSILDEAFEKYGAKQDRGELRAVAHLVADTNPQTVLEIGTAAGGSLYVWTQYFDSADLFLSVDKDHSPQIEGRCQSFTSEAKVDCLATRSQKTETEEWVNEHIEEDGIDFLFIDGGDTEWEVEEDYNTFSKYMNDGGVVAFHDILTHRNPEPSKSSCEVHKVWERMKGEADDFVEITRDPQGVEYGYGIMLF